MTSKKSNKKDSGFDINSDLDLAHDKQVKLEAVKDGFRSQHANSRQAMFDARQKNIDAKRWAENVEYLS